MKHLFKNSYCSPEPAQFFFSFLLPHLKKHDKHKLQQHNISGPLKFHIKEKNKNTQKKIYIRIYFKDNINSIKILRVYFAVIILLHKNAKRYNMSMLPKFTHLCPQWHG
jgi:hypothetical protein